MSPVVALSVPCVPGCPGPTPGEREHRCIALVADVAAIPGPCERPHRMRVEVDQDVEDGHPHRLVVIVAVDAGGLYVGDPILVHPTDVRALVAALTDAGRLAGGPR